MGFRDRTRDIENSPGVLFVDDRKIEVGSTRAFRLLVLTAELSGEQAAGEWTPNQQSKFFGFKQRPKVALEVAAYDRIIGLQCVEPGQILGLGDAERSGNLPGLPIRHSDGSNLAMPNDGIESAQGFLDGSDAVVRGNSQAPNC